MAWHKATKSAVLRKMKQLKVSTASTEARENLSTNFPPAAAFSVAYASSTA